MSGNWDGYGADAPKPELLDAAIALAGSFERRGDVIAPYVTPTRDGGVMFLWENDRHGVEIVVEEVDRLAFLYLDRATSEAIEFEGSQTQVLTDARVLDNIRRSSS